MSKFSECSHPLALNADPRNEAIDRFLNYANEYLQVFNMAVSNSDSNAAYRSLEHFLLFLTAAAQNLIKSSQGKLPSIQFKAINFEPKLALVLWAWEARNILAHNYVEITRPTANFCVNGCLLGVGSGSLEVGGFFFKDVLDQNGNRIPAPSGSTSDALRAVLNFWEFSCQKVRDPRYIPPKEKWYAELWALYEKDQSKQSATYLTD
jgi:hypothetical protein